LELVRSGREPIALVVTDVVMPGMGGRELADHLEALRPDLPVVFVSGYTEEDVVGRGLLRRGRPFLPKPFTPTALTAAVGSVLGREGEVSPP
jgi:CheY-like chemotaxis protein